MKMPGRRGSDKITVLVRYNRISVFFSLAPLLLTRDVAEQLDFTQSIGFCLKRDRNRHLLIVRYFEGRGLDDGPVDAKLMSRLRDRYDRIVFFDDGDGAGSTRLEVLPFVDLYLKKQLFRDRSLYEQRLYGKQLFTDYYHRRFRIDDPHPQFRHPMADPLHSTKLRVAWNLGVGSYPVCAVRERLGVAAARTAGVRLGFLAYRNPRPIRRRNAEVHDVHARFGTADRRPTIAFQRRLLLEKIGGDRRFLTGCVPPRRYKSEMQDAKMTLSPFGWGEICFRDFEAIHNRSLLMKPDMSHLETWPDVFQPHRTYVPIDWDGSDVKAVTERYLNDPVGRRALADAATEVYHDALARIGDRARLVVRWIRGE